MGQVLSPLLQPPLRAHRAAGHTYFPPTDIMIGFQTVQSPEVTRCGGTTAVVPQEAMRDTSPQPVTELLCLSLG